MNIVVLLKGSINKLPPILTTCYYLSDLGHSLVVACDDMTPETQKSFGSRNISFHLFHTNNTKKSVLSKAIKWFAFKKKGLDFIKQHNADLYWIASADTALAIGKDIWKLNYVLHIHELYDTLPYYRKHLGQFMVHAKKVIVPEETRAHIFRAWYHLKETPTVLPNKPYAHPRKRNLPITDAKAAEAFAKIPKGSKIVFYQGIASERCDLKPFAKAIEQLKFPWLLAIQSPVIKNQYYHDLLNNYHIFHIPYVSAPRHLEITSNVNFGIVAYTHINMNHEFCAPNKIWEYSGFGLPMIANDVYGLLNTIGKRNAGKTINLNNANEVDIKRLLIELDSNYDEFSRNSTSFFDSFDFSESLRLVVQSLEDSI